MWTWDSPLSVFKQKKVIWHQMLWNSTMSFRPALCREAVMPWKQEMPWRIKPWQRNPLGLFLVDCRTAPTSLLEKYSATGSQTLQHIKRFVNRLMARELHHIRLLLLDDFQRNSSPKNEIAEFTWLELIWRNVSLHHLCSGCCQNESSNSWYKHHNLYTQLQCINQCLMKWKYSCL